MGERGGAETHATIITVVESPLRPASIWAGTDDGNVQVTRDGGKTWTNVRPNIPRRCRSGTWVSRVEPSHFERGTAYVSFDGHRSDNFKPCIFKTTDYGKTWTKITTNLPANEPVYVVKEDLKNPNLLFAGTETRRVRVDRRRRTLAAADDGSADRAGARSRHPSARRRSHRRHARPQPLDSRRHHAAAAADARGADADAHLFQNRVATIWRGISRGATRGHLLFPGRNPLTIAQPAPGNSPPEITNSAAVHYYLKADQPGTVTLQIQDVTGSQVHTAQLPGTAGVHRYFWNLRFGAAAQEGRGAGAGGRRGGGGGRGGAAGAAAADPDAPPQPGGRGGPPTAGSGTYIVRLTVGGRTYSSVLTLRDDPGMKDRP